MIRNNWLVAAGLLSGAAALLHLGCIVGGAAWYRFFGAGERMAMLAEQGSARPTIITLFIASILAIWSAYAFSGAGLIARLPFLRTVLIAICAIYLVRAVALPLMLATMTDRTASFLIWSSAIVLVFGVVHAIGIWTGWSQLAGRP